MSGTKVPRRKILVSGASIAGPALAYWLHRYGFEVSVVERAKGFRAGGYPIDVRGTAVDVVERMGLLPRLRAAQMEVRKLTFVDGDGTAIATLAPGAVTGSVPGRDLELPRGALTALLHQATREKGIRYRFNDAIDVLMDDGKGIDVWFHSGARERFDAVIGADGLHSRTRALVFGPEEKFNHYLGRCFNLFSMPNHAGYAHESVSYAAPGRMAGIYATGDNAVLHAFLTFASDKPPFRSHGDVDMQRKRTAEVFANDGWEVPRLVEAMQKANDLFFDTVSQIRMPRWSSGRVALVGDAAYAPSFLSGQGTSLALVGAYVLAGELASQPDAEAAFAAYERALRPYVEANQALATDGEPILLPRTREELEHRNRRLAAGHFAPGGGDHAARHRKAHGLLELPDYVAVLGLGG